MGALSAHPASGRCHDHLSPRVLGFRKVLLSFPSSLLRPDPPVSTGSHRFPRDTGYTAGLGPTTWSGLPARPSLLWVNAPSLRAIAPTSRGGTASPQLLPAPNGFPQQNSASAPLSPPTPASVGDLLTTLQRSRDGTARKIAGPPGLVRPGVLLQPPRTYTPELARGRSPAPRVGYDYTALLGKDDDRTCTGWSAAVTGCASSRAQARTTGGREFPVSALSIAERGPSPTIAHVSCALSKIPYGGLSPVRLQAEMSR